ncbi:hypothetical protein C804_04763 [Lachnospiraceae bacterium A4]|nr:hypothetical protein C804_04763 [Lachnospiraceae bacterium A4]
MREHNILTAPVEFLDILELQREEEVNQHGRMVLSGHITDEQEEEYLGLLTGSVWETVRAVGDDGEEKTIFSGIITDFSITEINDHKKMTLEMMTGSSLMDEKKHFRSYQNPMLTYGDIFKMILADYADAALSFSRPCDIAADELVLQYGETDWAFLKRLAGRNHQFLVPDSRIKGTRICISLPQGQPFEIPMGSRYTIKKDLSGYREKRYQGMAVSEADCIDYIIQSRELYQIGDYTTIYGLKFYISQIHSRYERGELLHTYHLKREKGIEVSEPFNTDLIGCSLSAEVINVKEDKVQVKLIGDENTQQDINIWYPYATVYSTPDGTGWYCMPELGDRVRLVIPQQQEREAFVVSSVHVETNSADRSNPSHKSFKSKYQKEVRFTPDSIVITNNKGTRIELTDREGIHIVSGHSIMLEAAEDILLNSDTGSMIIAGDASVNLRQKGTSIQLDKEISFIGGNLKIQ